MNRWQHKMFPVYGYDEEQQQETEERIGWHVFSTLQVSEHLFVRATVENTTSARPDQDVPIWFVEWRASFSNKSTARQRLTLTGLIMLDAVDWAVKHRDQIEALILPDDARAALDLITPVVEKVEPVAGWVAMGVEPEGTQWIKLTL